MKEELTTAMHTEFTVDAETDLKHRVWVLLSECDRLNRDYKKLLEVYELTEEDVKKYQNSYLENK